MFTTNYLLHKLLDIKFFKNVKGIQMLGILLGDTVNC
jgi:hypothetical protein